MCCYLIGLWTFINKLKHTQLNICEKEELPCFQYLIRIFGFAFFRIVLMFKPVSSKDCKSENSLYLKI